MENLSKEQTQCAHTGCSCPGVPEVPSRSNNVYCSGSCAEGKGCDHPDCNCGSGAAAEPSA